jgi:hypothetical protein
LPQLVGQTGRFIKNHRRVAKLIDFKSINKGAEWAYGPIRYDLCVKHIITSGLHRGDHHAGRPLFEGFAL